MTISKMDFACVLANVYNVKAKKFSTWEYCCVNRNIDVSINCCLLLDRNNKLDVIIVLIYDILSKMFV